MWAVTPAPAAAAARHRGVAAAPRDGAARRRFGPEGLSLVHISTRLIRTCVFSTGVERGCARPDGISTRVEGWPDLKTVVGIARGGRCSRLSRSARALSSTWSKCGPRSRSWRRGATGWFAQLVGPARRGNRSVTCWGCHCKPLISGSAVGSNPRWSGARVVQRAAEDFTSTPSLSVSDRLTSPACRGGAP